MPVADNTVFAYVRFARKADLKLSVLTTHTHINTNKIMMLIKGARGSFGK